MCAAIIITVITAVIFATAINLVLDAAWIVLDCSTSSELAVPRF